MEACRVKNKKCNVLGLKSLIFMGLVFYPVTSGFSHYYWEFGQNKVQYRNFDWKVVETDKFNIIYYEGGDELAKFAKSVLTEVYDSLSRALSHKLATPAPIIIYNSHNEFEQTNVTLELIDESTGGFTEIFKNRVVVPFDGSYARFRHVLAHEFVHVFQFSITRGTGFQSMLTPTLYQVPLWFLEGMAEYLSLGWDSESDMVIRDAIYWNRLKWIQELYQIEGSYLMYKEGQSILKFIANRYGEQKVSEIFRKSKSLRGLDGAFKSVLGVDTEELNHLWLRELKKEYWAQCIGKDEAPEGARRLTKHTDYAFNIAPSISPNGNEIVFLSDRDGYESLYLMSSIDGRIKSKLISGGKTSGFESFHIMHGGIGWHPNSSIIAFVAKSKGTDVLYIMDVRRNKIIKRFTLPLDRIFSPSFSPNGEFIAIRGVVNGAADIYVLNYSTGELTQLTSDIYDDLTPSWSTDGKYIVFSSDRPSEGAKWEYGKYTIFKVEVDFEANPLIVTPKQILNDRATYVVSPLWVSVSDSIGKSDKLLFISNRTGINNLYVFDMQDTSSKPIQITNVIGGIFTPSISSNGELLAFSNYINLGWDVYVLKHPLKYRVEQGEPRIYSPRYTQLYEDTGRIVSKNLGLRFTPDWGGGSISYSPGGGIVGNLSFAVSDLLGNHRFYLVTSSPENLMANYYISYFYLPRRIDFGIANFKRDYFYWPGGDILYRRKSFGIGGLFEYPISRFERISLEFMGYKVEEKRYLIPENYREVGEDRFYLFTPSISWVYDNSLWGPTGPINGERCKLSFSSPLPVIHPTLLYNLYKIDLRKYIRLTAGYQVALRLINTGMWGKDVDYLVDVHGWPWLGGPDDLRGYPVNEFSGRNAGVLNIELRYPFIDYLKIAFPIPLTIRGIRGAMFCDFGYAVNSLRRFKFFEDGGLKDLKFNFGFGIRVRFPYFILKLDVAKNTNLIMLSKKTYWYLSLSPEF